MEEIGEIDLPSYYAVRRRASLPRLASASGVPSLPSPEPRGRVTFMRRAPPLLLRTAFKAPSALDDQPKSCGMVSDVAQQCVKAFVRETLTDWLAAELP